MENSKKIDSSRAWPTSSPDSVANEYDRLCSFIDRASWYNDHELLQITSNSVTATAKYGLDVGCGSGIALEYLATKHKDIRWIGIDKSPEMASRARERCSTLRNVSVYEGDLADFVLNKVLPRFDFVHIKNILHLLSEPSNALVNLASIMGSTGRILIIETVSPSSETKFFIGGLAEKLGIGSLKKHVFTRRELVKLVRSGGLDILGIRYHEQFIDVRDWIEAKASSGLSKVNSWTYLNNRMLSKDLRQAMKYREPNLGDPGRMLRLQMVIQCVRRFS